MNYKIVHKFIPAYNDKTGESKLLSQGDIVTLNDNDDLVTRDGFVITDIFRDFINNRDYFELVDTEKLDFNLDIKESGDLNDFDIKSWCINLKFKTTEKKAELVKNKILKVIENIEI